ncbi:hypothetical protein [Lentibacillus jeotgali]|uniref:hypothetical protein n=1 Tax=Lentibacillus jeotgali TaxID=558169 RepID=UPI000262807F|nr:hypothetical protein [Lentibacillus jeotgali]
MNYIRAFLSVSLLLLLVLTACSGERQEETANEGDSGGEEEKVVHLSAPGVIPVLNPTMADNDFSFNVPPEQIVDANNQNYELILTGWGGDY